MYIFTEQGLQELRRITFLFCISVILEKNFQSMSRHSKLVVHVPERVIRNSGINSDKMTMCPTTVKGKI